MSRVLSCRWQWQSRVRREDSGAWHKNNTLGVAYYQRVLGHFRNANTKQEFIDGMDVLAEQLLKESGKLK